MRTPQIALCGAVLSASTTATTLFASSYAGDISTLSLTEKSGNYTLTKTHESAGCAPNPSWLTLDPAHGVIYCLDEGLEVANGSINSFIVNKDGSLSLVQKTMTISGPVSGVIFGDPATERAIALAHYTGSSISTYTLNSSSPSSFVLDSETTFTLAQPGPNPARQDAPHEHEAILDPTGQYLLFPDLGADLVRVYSVNPEDLALTVETPLSVTPGDGPRHAVFYQPYGVACENCTTYMFLVAELSATVTSYAVTYPEGGGMAFQEVWRSGVYGLMTQPKSNAPAEIEISPDNRFLLISNRNNTSFQLPSSNGSTFSSDSISTFALKRDGTATFNQLAPTYGRFPRQFSLNRYGDLVAVGLQLDEAVVVLERDTATGLIGKEIARVGIAGNVTGVWWWE